MGDQIVIERRGAVQAIRINRPEKKNAFNAAMYAAMTKALADGDADPAVRCHVFLGVPGAFSAGNDLADFMAIGLGAEGGREVHGFLEALVMTQKPMVSGADGIAVGIGATLHLHCDLTFATARTVFSTPFVNLGITPEAGSSLLGPAILGHQRAFALLVMGEGLPAEAARAAGLIYEIVGETALEDAVFAAAAGIAAKPPEALRLARDLLKGDRSVLLARVREEGKLFMERLRSDEAKAAVMAFMARKRS